MKKDVADDRGASGTIEDKDDFGEAFAQAELGDPGADDLAATRESDSGAGATDGIEASESGDDPTLGRKDDLAQADDESDEKYAQRYKTLQGIHRHDREVWGMEKAQHEAENARLLAELEQLKQSSVATPAEKTAAAEAFISSLTDEQKTQLDEYEKDFEVVSQMEGLKRQIEADKLRKELDSWKAEILSKLETQEAQLVPLTTRIDEADEAAHFDGVKSQHVDYETYVEDGSLLEWINSKPKYMRPALLATYDKGLVEDVVELISDFKRENGIEQQQMAQDVIQRKAKKKLALTSVVTRRGAINPAMGGAEDYETAFEEALNKG